MSYTKQMPIDGNVFYMTSTVDSPVGPTSSIDAEFYVTDVAAVNAAEGDVEDNGTMVIFECRAVKSFSKSSSIKTTLIGEQHD